MLHGSRFGILRAVLGILGDLQKGVFLIKTWSVFLASLLFRRGLPFGLHFGSILALGLLVE